MSETLIDLVFSYLGTQYPDDMDALKKRVNDMSNFELLDLISDALETRK